MTRVLAAILIAFLTTPLHADEPLGRRYALLVGVKDYTGTELTNLRHAENDVTDLASVLRADGYRLVTLMTQGEMFARKDLKLQPTADNIRAHLSAVLADRRPADTVMIAFAGHGVTLKGTGRLYFCPEKADLARPETLIALGEVYDGLKGCKAGTRLLIADACRNEVVATRSKEADKLQSLTRPKLPDPPGGVAALFSCSPGEQAYESRKHPHGVFFYHLLEGLSGKAANRRGEVLLDRLVSHVNDEIRDTLLEEFGPGVVQKPHLEGSVAGAISLVHVHTGTEAFARGKALVDKHQHDAAYAALTEAIRDDPADPLRYAYRAWALVYRFRFDEALADCEEALKRNPQSAFALSTKALVLSWAGRDREAVIVAAKAAEADPKSPFPPMVRSTALAHVGRLDEALAEAEKGLQLYPNNPIALNQRAVVLSSRGDQDKAIADLTESLRLDPGYDLAYSNRAACYIEKGDTARALADCDAALRLDPKFAPAYHKRGIAYARAGNVQQALAAYNDAIRVGPSFINTYSDRAIAYARLGQFDKAVADARTAIHLAPEVVGLHQTLGVIYAAAKDFDQAIAAFGEAIRLDPKSAASYNWRGMAYSWKAGALNQALADYNRAIELDPALADTYRNRGLLLRATNPAQSQADFAKYTQLTGKNP